MRAKPIDVRNDLRRRGKPKGFVNLCALIAFGKKFLPKKKGGS